MVILRAYQLEAIEVIKQTFKESKRQYIEMPTGSGKTVTFLSYVKNNHKNILIIVPSKGLLNQIYSSALNFYHKDEISRKGDGFIEDPKKLHICIINSIRGDYLNFLLTCQFDIVIIDEAHHSQSNSYIRFIDNYSNLNKEVKFLGVTATPDRLDKKLIAEILYVCKFKLTIESLMEKHYLCDIEGYNIKTNIDISQIDNHNGDFSIRELYKQLSTNSRNNLIIQTCKKELINRKTLIFCINIQHSKEISKLLNENGIHASHIDGHMKDIQINSILNSFRNNEINVLCNCQILTEGFDEPAIDGIILARPTCSRALFLQMIGRGLRTFPGKENCKIIDIVDNHKSTQNFNSIISVEHLLNGENFKSFKELKDLVQKKILEISEFQIQKVNIFDSTSEFLQSEATLNMIYYLQKNNINVFHPISIDEASFLIWMHELEKEYKKNGSHHGT